MSTGKRDVQRPRAQNGPNSPATLSGKLRPVSVVDGGTQIRENWLPRRNLQRKKVRNIEPHLMDSKPEIEQFLADLLKQGRIREASEHLSRVHGDLKKFFLDKAEELSRDD